MEELFSRPLFPLFHSLKIIIFESLHWEAHRVVAIWLHISDIRSIRYRVLYSILENERGPLSFNTCCPLRRIATTRFYRIRTSRLERTPITLQSEPSIARVWIISKQSSIYLKSVFSCYFKYYIYKSVKLNI